jgi:D-glycero-D-manno-heptose 1,7-bisphosphate phosphatase
MSLDLPRSIMIGDAFSDLQAGAAAGISNLALVKTGRGADQVTLLHSSTLKHYSIFETLLDAIRSMILTSF